MRRCLRKRQRLGKDHVMRKAAETTAATGRKRKMGKGESQLATSSVQLKTQRLAVVTPENSALSASSGNSTCESFGSDHVLASRCSSNEGSDDLAKASSKFVDLEETEVALEFFSPSSGDSFVCRDRREMKQSREVDGESVELEPTVRARESNSGCRLNEMPSEAELEEFFAAAEKKIRKQFIDKYNYDIVKDQPVLGRYEWVQIHKAMTKEEMLTTLQWAAR